jgi:hypothetical protein
VQTRPASSKVTQRQPAPRPCPPPLPGQKAFPGLPLKIGLIVALACGSLAVGAFALPGRKPAVLPQELVADGDVETSAPAVQPVTPPPGKLPPPGAAATGLAPAAATGLAPASRAPAGPTAFDLPQVPPQLPADGAAYALARRITRHINEALAANKVPSSPLAGDAEFVRRAHLDIVGRIPTRQRVIAFLNDRDPLKRAKLIDELLASSEYGEHFARIWADILVKRDFDNNKNLRTDRFVAWLADRFNQNSGWDQVVRDMVTARGEEQTVPETFFILAHQDNRQVSPSKLTGAVGNLFMGIQVHCAECHQHPFTSQWGMNDFWGLAAFFAHTRAERPVPAKGKKANGPAKINEVEQTRPPRNKKGAKMGPTIRPGLVINVPDPNDPRKVIRTARGKLFESKQPPGVGKVPYRPALARWLTSADNRYFAPAAVNRVWAHFFARGLVNPIEDMNPQNKATHPALLRELSAAFVGSKFDLKDLVRAICNSEPYQRSSRPTPANASDEKWYSRMPVKVMEARVLLDSLAVVTGQKAPEARRPMGKQGARSPAGTGGNPLVRFFDTREYDDDPTEFSYGIPQLLRLMNTRLTAAAASVAQRLISESRGDADRMLDDLYLTTLARRPAEHERVRMKAYLARHRNTGQGPAGVLWALLNCAEFVSNH